MGFRDRIAHAWNAFTNVKSDNGGEMGFGSFGTSYTSSGGRTRAFITNEQTIISSIYVRLGIDVASIYLRHIRKDDDGRFVEMMKSGLNDCLTVEANLDQAGTQFRQDIAMTLFDKGYLAIVPVDTGVAPNDSGGFDIRSLRVGHIVAWFPKHVRVSVYNENSGKREELILPKRLVAIVENPLYSVMNEPNSILQRIIRKLQLLDAVDEASGSGKLDLIIQLPYTIKTETKQKQAESRREQIETQLKGSKYGIAYTDGTERITQLNRPAENNMLTQIEYLMGQLYGQLGMDETIIKGTADEATMLNYYNRTVEPVLRAIVEAMSRTFLTKTARTQGQTVDFQRDPFKLVPISDLADIGDKLLRNEVLTSNEMRQIIGFRPAKDPKADQLVNSNMPQPTDGQTPPDPNAQQPSADAQSAQDAQDALFEQTMTELENSANDIVNSAGG